MSNAYDLGDKPQLRATFAVDGTNTDPTAAALIVKLPDGSRQSYLSAAGFSDQGSWDADANSPTLANGTGTTGHYYTVDTAGAVDFGDGSQSFAVGDYAAYDGESWLLIPAPQTGTLTNSATGVYDYYLPLHQVGRYSYRYEGLGIVHAAGEESFRVVSSAIR
jgi:hypothetical protein